MDPTSLPEAMAGVDAVVHLVGIIDEVRRSGVTFERIHVEGTRNVVQAAKAAGVSRFLHMSANGARAEAPSPYHTTKWRAEEIVRGTEFDHSVVFRPSIIFGDPGAEHVEFATRLWKTLLKPFPVWPVFGDGAYELQPVHAETVAEGFAKALDRNDLQGRSFCVAGRERITYVEALMRIAAGGGMKPRPIVPIPMPLARLGVVTAGRAGLLPISPAQFQMLVEGNTCDSSDFFATFGVESPPFSPENLAYVESTQG